MKLPPYPKGLDATPVTIRLNSGMTENGEFVAGSVIITKCRASLKRKAIRDREGHVTYTSGTIYFHKDIAPDVEFQGTAELGGKVYPIRQAYRRLNPDGTTHHLEVELL